MDPELPKIYGFNKTSEAGNSFAASVFLGGCNLRCPYCINSRLVIGDNRPKDISIKDVKKYIFENRIKIVIISGGEPTLSGKNKLNNLISEIKNCQCDVGMSTNGVNFEIIQSILNGLNYVAVDIKTMDEKEYKSISENSVENSLKNVIKTINILRLEKKSRSDFNYEIRTTLYPEYIGPENIESFISFIEPNEKWVLQQYRPVKNMIDKSAESIAPYSLEDINKMIEKAKNKIQNMSLRYV